MLKWLTDRIVLRPTRHEIACQSERRWITWSGGQFEAWVQRTGQGRPDLYVLKFPGTGGRAERSTSHPADCWDDLSIEIWTINPPGYGGSPGRASLRSKAAVAEAAWASISDAAEDRPVIVTGNSLGTIPATFLASRFPLGGLILRNPVPLRHVIRSRYGRLSSIIAWQVPNQLCALTNAGKSQAPAVIVSCGKDRIVPSHLQTQFISRYAGDSRVLLLTDADHSDPPDDQEMAEYETLLQWLRHQVLKRG